MNPPGHAAITPPSAEALFRFQVVSQVLSQRAGGLSLSRAVKIVAREVHVTLSGQLRRVSLRTVYRWQRAYESNGLAGLEPEAHPGTDQFGPLLLHTSDLFLLCNSCFPVADPESPHQLRRVGRETL